MPIALPSTVKVERDRGLPAIAFCVVADTSFERCFFGASDFGIYELAADAEKIDEPRLISPERHNSYVTGMVRAGRALISGSYDGSLIWWDVDSGNLFRRVNGAHDRWIRKLAVNANETRIASVADDMRTKLWDAKTGDCIATFEDYDQKTPNGYPSMLFTVAFSPDGRWLATANKTGRIVIRDAATGEFAASLEAPGMYTWDPRARRHSIGGIRSIAFSHDGFTLAVGGIGKIGNIDHLGGPSRIEVFNWQSGERLHLMEDDKLKGLNERLQFTSDDTSLIAAGGDNAGFVSVWNPADGKLLAQEKAPMHVHDFVLQESDAGLKVIAVGHQKAAVITIS